MGSLDMFSRLLHKCGISMYADPGCFKRIHFFVKYKRTCREENKTSMNSQDLFWCLNGCFISTIGVLVYWTKHELKM